MRELDQRTINKQLVNLHMYFVSKTIKLNIK